jgi:asparagine synthase (glutamine-hydrolysing)
MPGMTGIIAKDGSVGHKAALDAMVQRMLHEPFYSSGTYVNEQSGLYVGWACHEGSFSDCLPIWNEKKNICLIFNGEEFPEQTIIDNLKLKGHAFDADNASYLVHQFEEVGWEFLSKLNGWFNGLLVDLRENKAVLFNDRFGFQRIYYHENERGFYFSSEAKSLLKVLPDLRRLDLPSLGEAFSCGCVLQNRTLFSGVSLLPGGAKWTFSPGRAARRESYFDPSKWDRESRLSVHEYSERLTETFSRVLPKYFRGKERIGMSLTGGLDGRMIMAWMPRPARDLPCYTFGGAYRECNDVILARQVAHACQQWYQVIPVDGAFLPQFPACAERAVYLSDGAMDVTGSVELYVNRLAREIAPVRLTGNYGSEIIRGNVAFKPGSLFEGLFEPSFARLVHAAGKTYAGEAQGDRLSFIAFKQVPWHHYSRLSLEQSQLTLRSPYLDNDLVDLLRQVPADLVVDKGPSLQLIAEGNLMLSKIATDRGILYRRVPVVTKANQLWQEFTFKAEYAYDYGMPQWLAAIDHHLSPLHLEKLFLGRHKFHHFRVWYRDDLSRYVKEILLDPRTLNRPYLRRDSLEAMVNDHIKGNRNYTREIHKVLTSELIERQLIEQN